MDRNIINLMSYNSTGLCQNKISWINGLSDFLNIDLLQIQEHFKAIKTVNSFFSKWFNKYWSLVKPAVRENITGPGRPKGGLTQLVRKNRNFKKERINTDSWRLQAQIIHVGCYKLCWVNCYFPVDPRTQILANETELTATILEIENIIENSNFNDIIISGDFNYESTRHSRHVRIIEDFLAKYDLTSVWSKCRLYF